MKSVLISIQPKWCELTASGKKRIEVRKTRPQIDTPFKCYIYMTATKERCRFWEYITAYQNENGKILDGSQKVIGEFVCDRIDKYKYTYTDGLDIDDDELLETMLDREEINIYANGKGLYGWHISDLKIYDTPKELGYFLTPSGTGGVWGNHYITRPFQSWGYVEELRE